MPASNFYGGFSEDESGDSDFGMHALGWEPTDPKGGDAVLSLLMFSDPPADGAPPGITADQWKSAQASASELGLPFTFGPAFGPEDGPEDQW
ncbi:MAG TPA: hypothetical protein VK674_00505 [Candidatus Limnocylindria bacterium]|nr:hypothetical protein [Candidatus Limnocylindria bacterium]